MGGSVCKINNPILVYLGDVIIPTSDTHSSNPTCIKAQARVPPSEFSTQVELYDFGLGNSDINTFGSG